MGSMFTISDTFGLQKYVVAVRAVSHMFHHLLTMFLYKACGPCSMNDKGFAECAGWTSAIIAALQALAEAGTLGVLSSEICRQLLHLC